MKSLKELLSDPAYNHWLNIRNNPSNTGLSTKLLLSSALLSVRKDYCPLRITPIVDTSTTDPATINTLTNSQLNYRTEEQKKIFIQSILSEYDEPEDTH